MRKIYIALLSMFFAIPAFAQNLVNNPGFENVNANCSGLTGAGYVNLTDWYNPDPTDTCSTPDWFATCLNAIFPTHAPNSQMGYQVPHGGNAYAGFISYDQSSASYREYVEGSLSAPLVAAQKYKVSLFLSLANSSHFSVNHFGIYFSNAQNSFATSHCVSVNPLPNTPQIDSNFTITDTTNWVELKWTYTATGGEQYFTIGNFYNNANTTATAVPHGFSFTPFAYYFIDDVSIEPDSAKVDTTGPESISSVNYNNAALSIYPSPASNYITVAHNAGKTITEISIINSIGSLVYKQAINSSKETIHLDGMANGIYTIRVRTAEGILVRKLEILK